MSRERTYLLVIGLLLAALSVKSLFIDGVGPLEGEAEQFSDYVEQTISERQAWVLNKTEVLSYKIVGIAKTEGPPAEIILRDPETESETAVVLSGPYRARVRKYIFRVLPYGDFTISTDEDRRKP